jgi:ATP-binding cassette subfamily B protein
MRANLRSFRVLMGMSFGAAPWRATLFLLSGVVMALLGPGYALSAKLMVDAVQSGSLDRAYVAAAILAGLCALGMINTLYYVDLLFTVAEKTGLAIDRRLMRLMAGISGIEHHERPEYIDRLDLLREERARLAWMTNALAGMVRVAVQLVAGGILLARISPVLLLLPLAGVVSFVLGRRAQELEFRSIEQTLQAERLRRHLFEVATNAAAGKEIRVFGLSRWLIDRHHAASGEVNTQRDRASRAGALLQAVDGLVSGAAYIGAIGLVLMRAVDGSATAGDVVLTVGLAASMNALVTIAVMYGTSFLRVLQTAQRFLWLDDYAARMTVRWATPAAVPERLHDGIELRDVVFRYPDTGRPILDGISLRLPAGSVVALVGENGAGKTTLAKLLCRFYEPTGGSISVDGIDLRQIDIDRWRTRIAAAFQDFSRFEFLTRETVGVGDLAQIEQREAVGAALGRAGADDLPSDLPMGLETQLGREWEGGIELSGGQWQKLALGRAMMREDPLLLILDEPTASLDADTEHQLFARYAAAARESGARSGTVTVLVSHRFSTVRMADLIVVLEDGRVREQGSHEELMRVGGLYSELYEMQARAYR